MIPTPPAIVVAAAPRDNGPGLAPLGPALVSVILKRANVAHATILVGRVVGDTVNVATLGTDDGPKADEHTLFAIDGLTETITALLLADGVRRGEVRLDQTIDDLRDAAFHPPSPSRGPLTLEDLATHRTAFPAIPLHEAAQPYSGIDRAALIAAVNAPPVAAPAHAAFSGSPYDFALLGNVLADRAGVSYAALVRDRVFVPLQMNDSVADTGSDARVVTGRTIGGAPAAPWRYNALAPAGGVRSSMIDLTHLADAMFVDDNGPLAADMRIAITPRAAVDDAHVGLAWRIDGDDRAVWAGGGSYGSTAFMAVAPKAHVAVIILCNVGVGFGNSTFDDIGLRLLADTVAIAGK